MLRFKWNNINLIVGTLLFIVFILIQVFSNKKLNFSPIIEDLTPGSDYAYTIALDSEDFYVAGSCDSCGSLGSLAWQIEKRRKSDGQLDPNFGNSGRIISDPTSSDDEAYSITIDSSYMYIAGVQAGQSSDYAWRIEKRDKITGAYDPHFGLGGYIVSNSTRGDDYAFSITNDDSFIYLVGSQPHDSPLSTHAWRIEKRDKITGAYDPHFGLGGYIISNPVNEDNEAYSVVTDNSFIYIAGLEGGTGADGKGVWRIEKRDKITGAYDPHFGLGGYIISDPTVFIDEARSIAIDDSFIYLAGYQSGNNILGRNWTWRIEKRDKITGAYDPHFGLGGYVVSDPTSNNDLARSIFIDNYYVYIGGHQNGSDILGESDRLWRIEKRDKITGAYDPHFGLGGYIIENPSTGDDFIYSIITDSSYIYVVGYQVVLDKPGNFAWRIEKRKITNGQ